MKIKMKESQLKDSIIQTINKRLKDKGYLTCSICGNKIEDNKIAITLSDDKQSFFTDHQSCSSIVYAEDFTAN